MTIAPPQHIVDAAIRAARRSPCAKSKRGVVVYVADSGIDIASGSNGPPAGGACAGDAACREACGKICVHAEMRALRTARDIIGRAEFNLKYMVELDAVHVKIDGTTRVLVAGGGPSCWQCSREVLDVGLGGFWLYEKARCSCTNGCYAAHLRPPDDGCTCPLHQSEGQVVGGQWRRYTADEFHAATLAANRLPALVTL